MRKFSINVLAALLLMLLPAARGSAAPNGGGEEDKTSNPTLNVGRVNAIAASYDEDSKIYTISTIGADPYISSNPLTEDLPEDSCTLSFEYTCTTGVSDVQIFFADPLSEPNSVPGLQIPPTKEGEWALFEYDARAYRLLHDWGYKGNYIRLDFGDVSGVTIKLRRIHFGAKTKKAEEPVADYRELLQNVVDSIYDMQINFYSGTTPGYVSAADSANYTDTFGKILDLQGNDAATQDQLKEAVADLRNLIADTYAKIIPVPDGNYFIESANPAFEEQQPGLAYAMLQKDGDQALNWAKLDETAMGYYFYVKRLDNGRYIIQNLKDYRFMGESLGDARAALTPVNFTTDSIEQVLTPSGKGTFYISTRRNPLCYLHALGHNYGAGTSGAVQPASTKEDPELWKFVVADTTNLPAYRNAAASAQKIKELEDSTNNARLKLVEIKAPTNGLIKEASQLSTNCSWMDEYGVDKLIDGDGATHFHSTTAMNLYSQDEWLQIDLNRDNLNKFRIQFRGRDDSPNWHDTPNDIVIKATNTPDDEASWTQLAHFDKGFPGNIRNAFYVSPTVVTMTPYRYVRMYVKGTASGNVYWNLSEFQIFASPLEASEGSLYSKVSEMKVAGDELEAALDVADEHMANQSVDGTEMKAVNAALAKISEIEHSSDRIQATVNSANDLYKSLFVIDATKVDATKGLIKEVNTKNDGTNQLWSNCTWTGITEGNDNYDFNKSFIDDGYNLLGTLIDDNDQTYWHSDPNGFDVNNQQGYFQIDTKRTDVSSYAFMFYRRHDFYVPTNTYRVGQVPATAEVYATNDEAVGSDVNSAMDSWTQIGKIANIPNENTDGVWPYYTATVGDGTAYRFVRIRLHDSSQPYFGLSGFNVFDGNDMYDPEASQYSYVTGMKEVADKMKTLANEVQVKLNNSTATLADNTELQEAIDAVKALYQDQAGLADLIAKTQRVIETADEGQEIGQLSDGSTLSAAEKAIDAATDLKTADTQEFNKVKKDLEDAYEAVLDAIVQPVPGKWYYILSATSEEDASPGDGYYFTPREKVRGAAIYVLSKGGELGRGTEEGEYTNDQLRWGMDDIKKKPREGDVDAIWRFVAAPDSFGKRAYYIQNMRTGLYLSTCHASAGYYYQRYSATVPYRIDFVGSESFNLTPLAGARPGVHISLSDNARQVVSGEGIASVPGNRAAFTFEEFDPEENPTVNISYPADSARILTLPFAVKDIDRNEGVKAYTVHSVVSENGAGVGIGLKEKTSFAAGEPFILVIGDTAKHTAESGYKALEFDTPEASEMNTDLVADTVNGLIGTFPRIRVKAPEDHDYLYYRSLLRVNKFKEGSNGTYSYAQTGYIDPALVVNQEGEPDVVLRTVNGTFRTEVVNAISKIAADSKNGKVNVYTVDGSLVKKNVSAADAVKGLKKGLYIIGKQKVLVK